MTPRARFRLAPLLVGVLLCANSMPGDRIELDLALDAAAPELEIVLEPATSDEPLDIDNFEVVSDEELSEQRGGFIVSGMQVNFGAEIRTFLNGELVLQTNVSWIDNQATSSQIASAALTPVDAATLRDGMLSTGAVTIKVGDQQVYLANDGQTAIIHPTDGALQNVLVNTASGISTRQEVTANVDLSNYAQFRSEAISARALEQINSAINLSAIGGLGH